MPEMSSNLPGRGGKKREKERKIPDEKSKEREGQLKRKKRGRRTKGRKEQGKGELAGGDPVGSFRTRNYPEKKSSLPQRRGFKRCGGVEKGGTDEKKRMKEVKVQVGSDNHIIVQQKFGVKGFTQRGKKGGGNGSPWYLEI